MPRESASQPVPVTLPSGRVIHISEPQAQLADASATNKRLWRLLVTAPRWRGAVQQVQNQLRADDQFGREGPAALRNAFASQGSGGEPGQGTSHKGGDHLRDGDGVVPDALRPTLSRLRKPEPATPTSEAASDGQAAQELELAKRKLHAALLSLYRQPPASRPKLKLVPASAELSVSGRAAPEAAAKLLVQLLAKTDRAEAARDLPPGTTVSLTVGPAEGACCFRLVGRDGVGMQEIASWLSRALQQVSTPGRSSGRSKRPARDYEPTYGRAHGARLAKRSRKGACYRSRSRSRSRSSSPQWHCN